MINNLGNIWGEMNKNKIKVNKNFKQKKIIKKKFITQKNTITSDINIFNNIYASKSGENKTTNAINNKSIKFSIVNDSAKKYWGTPTWFLFHSIAARINKTYYSQNFTEIWNFIKLTCVNLPCPYCRNHAVSYVNKVAINDINTKDKLINVLYNFHNFVNRKNGKSLYKKEELEIYEKANMQKIFNLFNQRFFKSYYKTREFQDWTKSKYKIILFELYNKIKIHLV